VFFCVNVVCSAASEACGARFERKFHPGVWSPKTSKYSCCECINKRVPGCISTTVQINSFDNSFLGNSPKGLFFFV